MAESDFYLAWPVLLARVRWQTWQWLTGRRVTVTAGRGAASACGNVLTARRVSLRFRRVRGLIHL
jgi:hypothetical protein